MQLTELAEIVTGSTPKASETDSWGDHLDFVTPSDQGSGREAAPERRLSVSGAQRLRRRIVPAGSTALTCIGSTIGKVTMNLRPTVTNQQINSLVARDGVSDPGFIYYAVRDWSPDLKAHASGSATPIINKATLGGFTFDVPPLKDQRSIAEVLGALDDKIAANDHVITTAQQLMVALVSTATKTVTVSELASHTTRSLKPDDFDDLVAHFSLPAFDVDQMPERAERESIKSNKFALTEPCVLISKLNPRIPRIWDVSTLPGEMAVGSTEFVTLVPRGVSTSCLWAALSAPAVSADLQGLVAGTSGSHQRVKPAELLGLEVQDPRSLDTSSSEEVNALGAVVHDRRLERSRLAATRDQLLPLLMSGRVQVKDVFSSEISCLGERAL